MPLQPFKEIKHEVTNILSQLIQIDTTNPPGNETTAANWLSQNLASEGIDCKIYESAQNRGNLVARIKSTGEKPRILLLSHLDVVPANAEEWTVSPFGGLVKDGFVWGRGALDMKGMTAIEVMAFKLLKRNNVKLKGDVILACTADEEKGGKHGAEFLMQKYPEKVFSEYVLNEGGGSSISTGNRNVFTVNTAEKGLLWLRVQARGTSGHGSLPDSADNAIVRMNNVVTKLANFRGELKLIPVVRDFLSSLASEDSSLKVPLTRILTHPEESDSILTELNKTAPAIVDEIRPRIRMTITPTIIYGGFKENVIPSECTAVFDCRVLPGQTTTQVQTLITRVLADVGFDKLSFEVIQAQEPSESSPETPLFNTIRSVLVDFEPECGITPVLMNGGTDSRFFRRAGAVCYGFHPLRSETRFGEELVRREHGADERISVENLIFGTSVLYETLIRFMT
jgi:acetylornithine deacetylase/succinyl-diaminopimelate desuccinylase-like protein